MHNSSECLSKFESKMQAFDRTMELSWQRSSKNDAYPSVKEEGEEFSVISADWNLK